MGVNRVMVILVMDLKNWNHLKLAFKYAEYSLYKLKLAHFIFLFSPGKVVYTGVTFAGQIGFATAQRPNAVTVSLDERDQGFLWQNILQALLDKKVLPVSFVIRNVVSSAGMDFDHAVKMFSQAPFMADGYLIVGGVGAGQGAVITRNREDTADIWYLNKDAGKSP